MPWLKIAKILFICGAMSFVTKPFFGFAMFNQHSKPLPNSILVKIFAKRNPEPLEVNNFDLSSDEKKPLNPGLDKFPGFLSLVNVNYPGTFAKDIKINDALPRDTAPRRCGRTWLLCKKLVI